MISNSISQNYVENLDFFFYFGLLFGKPLNLENFELIEFVTDAVIK